MDQPSQARRDEPNALLASLPEESYQRVAALCELVDTPRDARLCEAGQAMRHVHFPVSGLLSVIFTTADGMAVEVGTIGFQGMSGISLFHGVDAVPTSTIAQLGGSA